MYSLYKYCFVVPLFAVLTVLMTLMICLSRPFGMKATGWCGIVWARVMQFVTPMHVNVVGRENIQKGQSYVIVANHQSAYDIFVVYGSLGVDFRWILKQELRKVPVLGFACYVLGHIFIDRRSGRHAFKSLQEAKMKLVDGVSVVIFPEGHRSGRREMGPLKTGAFKMAMDLELPILPISIKDTYKVMGATVSTLRPGRATLTIHQQIDIKQYEGDRDSLISKVKDIIQSAV